MILRVLRGRAGQEDVERLLDDVQADIDDWAKLDAGLRSAQPAFRPTDDGIEFLLISTWTSAEAVVAQGGDVTRPRGRLGASGRLRAAHANHYELVINAAREDPQAGHVVRMSTISLDPRRSSAFYEHVRKLWDELVGDSGLVALHLGRRADPDQEQAVVISVWESLARLEAATAGGFVGGAEMGVFYRSEPTIEHFTALRPTGTARPGD